MLHPKEGSCFESTGLPDRIASTAAASSLRVTASGDFQLSSILPWYGAQTSDPRSHKQMGRGYKQLRRLALHLEFRLEGKETGSFAREPVLASHGSYLPDTLLDRLS